MEKLIQKLEEMKKNHERIRGSQKMGIGSHWWDGRAQGIQDAIDLIKKLTTQE